MFWFKQIIFAVVRMLSWIFLIRKGIRRQVTSPGPSTLCNDLPNGFSCSKFGDPQRIYKFSVGTQQAGLLPVAIKRRSIIVRYFLMFLNHVGIKINQSPYFEVVPLNDAIRKNILNNKPLLDNLMSLFYTHNQSFFKVKWLFSVGGRLWAETDSRLLSVQLLIPEDMVKIANALSNVLRELEKIPGIYAESQQPLQLMKINGFINGLIYCAYFEFIWVIFYYIFIQNSILITYIDLVDDAFKITLTIVLFALVLFLISIRDFPTRLLALKYNAVRFCMPIFFSVCFILFNINCYTGIDDAKLYEGVILKKHTSPGRRPYRPKRYSASIKLTNQNEPDMYRISKHAYDALHIGDEVYIYLYKGALGYQWWDGKVYQYTSSD